MKTLKTILTVTLFSAFLFSCEADQDIYEEENTPVEQIETDEFSSETDSVEESNDK